MFFLFGFFLSLVFSLFFGIIKGPFREYFVMLPGLLN